MTTIRQHVDSLISLTDDEFAFFESLLIPKKLRKRQFLIQEGDLVRYQYFVEKGCLRAYQLDDHDTEHILQFAVEGWWISDYLAYFGGQEAQLNIDCYEDCTLLALSAEAVEQLYERVPQFERFFRLKLTGAFLSLQRRVLTRMNKTSLERYTDFLKTYPTISQRVPNHQIASYLGITPESLSRLRAQAAKS
jgi:CRP/FNR family transcriptional regulator, anaerobic regulatory protein